MINGYIQRKDTNNSFMDIIQVGRIPVEIAGRKQTKEYGNIRKILKGFSLNLSLNKLSEENGNGKE